ncbi:MAG TPA: hypothetical protein VFD62_06585 [Pyrinomonadaceae bacterium]|nr:hypothetical protein [Pyrinomonadaceae bacterium]
MRFIEVAHPEGGRLFINIDHITAAHYRATDGDMKTRLGLDLDQRQNDIVLFGEEAERVWQQLQELNQTSD